MKVVYSGIYFAFNRKQVSQRKSMYLQPIITQYFASNKSEIWP